MGLSSALAYDGICKYSAYTVCSLPLCMYAVDMMSIMLLSHRYDGTKMVRGQICE